MLSSSAERLYWFARYLERTENTARLLSVYTNLILDLPKGVEFSWSNLLNIFGANKRFTELYDILNEENTMRFLISDSANHSSLFSTLSLARENLRTSRALMPDETWEQVNTAQLYAKNNIRTAMNRSGRVLILKQIMQSCHCVSGSLSGAMSHNNSYRFIRLGRFIERADMTTRILDIASVLLADDRSDKMRQYETTLWMNVLISMSALLMYRQHQRYEIESGDVLDFLLNDPDFPRSVKRCINEIEICYSRLPKSESLFANLRKLKDCLAASCLRSISPSDLHKLLDDIQVMVGITHKQIETNWFLAN